jgi:hypothetical protein
MSESITLIKANPLLPAEDYNALRSQGIDQLAALGSDIWTDYNFSDPGITILEAVTYAITDLAYRTGFDVKDLLAPENLTADTWNQVFYTARQILHNAPLTIDDYRKLIIDIKGVRNAWVTPGKDYEVPIWIDYNAYEYRQDQDCGCTTPAQKLCLGQLGLDPVDTSVYTTNWAGRVAAILGTKNPSSPGQLTVIQGYDSQVKAAEHILKNPTASPAQKEAATNEIAAVQKTKAAYEKQVGASKQQLIDELKLVSRTVLPSKIVELEGLYNIMVEYEDNVTDTADREAIRQQVVERLSANRNLCEDTLSVDAAEYEDFGLGASFVVDENADTDAILAQVFFEIYKYFTPSVPFYTIDQMIAKGYQVDEIFEGPALDHGFIDNTELEQTDFYRDLHLSDLINIISGIPGIQAITYLHLPFSGFKKDTSHSYFTKWIDSLQGERKIARIQPTLSQAIFCKQREIITYYTGGSADRRPDRMLKLFGDLKILERKYKLTGVIIDFPVPVGEYMNLEDYYPVTYSLPECYGVSDRAGLSSGASQERQVQALQLKGYMLFFEQLLAGQLVQLNHLADLFSFDDTVSHTYFTRVLTELDGLKDLLIDQQNRGAGHFDQVINDFTLLLQGLTETPDLFLNRRNRLLDHLLARFSEDMSEYEALCRWLIPNNVEQRLLADKIRLLKNGEYVHISSERGLGYNYALNDSWDSPNVSGAERRISRLLGFADVGCRSLVPSFIATEPSMETDEKTKQPVQKKNVQGDLLYNIQLLDPDNPQTVLLTSVDVKDGCCLSELMNDMMEHADDQQYYIFQQDLKRKTRKTSGTIGSFWFELYDDTNPDTAVLLATSPLFDSNDKAQQAFQRVLAAMLLINNNEGLHLVEHILLRPKLDIEYDELGNPIKVEFLDICLDNCDRGIGLGEGVQYPPYRIKTTRVPADKCYDNMPWVLSYLEAQAGSTAINYPFLFQQVYTDTTPPVPMKFRKYPQLTQRIQNLREFGSERINYEIISNDAATPADIAYGFIIREGDTGVVLAQSLYQYSKKDPQSKTTAANDIELAITMLMEYFSFELDLYCQADPCDNNEDPYSFRATVVLPCWPKRLRDPGFRNLVEKTIQTESPAHVDVRVVWLDIPEMQRFESAYSPWLQEMAATEMPAYEKVNPLVDVLNTLQPCGCCNDECD